MFNGRIIKDWDEFDHKNPEHRKMLLGALQYFLAMPDRFIEKSLKKTKKFVEDRKELREAQMKIQEFTTTGDFPASILPIIEKFHAVPTYDNAYEQIFDIRDFSGSARNGFDILDVESGLAFRRVLIGEKLKVYQMSGTKQRCYFDFYGGALGWHRQLFDDKEYWTIEDNAIEFRNKAYQFRASVYYALIEAISTIKGCCAWITPSVPVTHQNYLAIGDAMSLNFMAQTILLNVVNKGYGVTPANTQFIVLTPLQLRGRIRQALNVAIQAFTGAERHIDYKFQQITTLMLTNANRVYVILPKKKLKGGYRMDLSLFADFDILSYTDTSAGWMRYGGCIADSDQIECLDIEPMSGSCPTT